MDPPDHGPYRKLGMEYFNRKRVQHLAERIEEITTDLLDDVAADGEETSFDFIDKVAVWLPFKVIAELLNLPELDELLEQCGLYDDVFTPRDVALCFTWSRMQVIEYHSERGRRMEGGLSFEDFLEAVARLADMSNLWNPLKLSAQVDRRPLALKLPQFVKLFCAPLLKLEQNAAIYERLMDKQHAALTCLSVVRAIASIEAVVAKSVAKALGARQPDAPVCQLAPPPAPPRSVSPAARPRSVSRSRSPRPDQSVPVTVFREDATVRPLRVVVTVPARSTLRSVKDALADLLNARDGVVFELRMTKKGSCVLSTFDLTEVEDIDHDYDLVAYELDAGLANERTVNVYMGARSMCSWTTFGQPESETVSYERFGWPICMAFAAGATCGDVRRDVAAWFARFSLSPHLSDAGLGARVPIVSTDGTTGKRDLPADNDERLPADVQALVVAWTEDEDLKEFIDARELYAVDDHVSAHDYAYPNLAPGSPTPSPSCTWATIRG